MSEALVATLGALGAGLNERARTSFHAVLPAALREAVAARMRRVGGLDAASLTPLERTLLEPPAPEVVPPPDGEELDDAAAAESLAGAEQAVVLAGSLLGALCVHADPRAAAALVSELPGPIQGPLLHGIITTSPQNRTSGLGPDAAAAAERLRSLLGQPAEWGVEAACSILRAVQGERPLSRAISAVAEIDDEIVLILQNHLFLFDDLLKLRDPELQVLMLQVDNATLAQALRSASDTVRKRLMQNVSARRRGLLAEEEEYHEEATAEEIELAQGSVMNSVRLLYENGKIDTYFGSTLEDSRPQAGSGEGVDQESGADEPEGAPEDAPEEEAEEDSEKPAAPPAKRALGGLVRLLLGAVFGVGGELREDGAAPGSRRRVVLGAALGGAVLLALWLVVAQIPTDPGDPTGSTPAGSTSSGGRAAAPSVLVAGEMEAASGAQPAAATAPAAAASRTRLPTRAQAIVELEGVRSQVEASRGAELYREEVESDPGPGGLYLRVGRVRTTVLDEGFYVSSPVARIEGETGAVFSVRVVLDATTTVEVERGRVEVASALDASSRSTLRKGDRGRFDALGNRAVTRVRQQ